MKILVKPRYWIENKIEKDPDFYLKGNFISIYSSEYLSDECYSPFIQDRYNILKLQFDDLSFGDQGITLPVIFFKQEQAKEIVKFISTINLNKILFIHCDAGISRSGAVGSILNEYFNKYQENNKDDDEFFLRENKQIQPNKLVYYLLKKELFGTIDYTQVFK